MKQLTLALVAHDAKKADMAEFVAKNGSGLIIRQAVPDVDLPW